MKKSNPVTTPLFVGLTALSMFCYVYLHKVALDTTGHCPSAIHETVTVEEVPGEGSNTVTPAIFLAKRIFSLLDLIGND